VDLKTRHRIPLQRDRRAELAALAELMSAQAELREARPGDEPFEIDEVQLRVRSREIRRRWRNRRLIVAGLLLLAVITVAGLVLSALNPPSSAASSGSTRPGLAISTTPAGQLGAQARARLARGQRPVTAFGCVGAYLTDAPGSGGVLATPGPGTAAYDEYMSACLSDMSASSGPGVG
jgi:hypothetical protein